MYNLDKTNINISSDTEAVLSKFWSHCYILKVIQDTKYNLVHDVAAGNVGAIIQFLQYGLSCKIAAFAGAERFLSIGLKQT